MENPKRLKSLKKMTRNSQIKMKKKLRNKINNKKQINKIKIMKKEH